MLVCLFVVVLCWHKRNSRLQKFRDNLFNFHPSPKQKAHHQRFVAVWISSSISQPRHHNQPNQPCSHLSCACVCVEKESRERGDTWSIRGAKARVSDCVCAQGEEPAEPAAPAAQANHVPVSTAAISPCHATAGTHTVRCVSMLLLC